MACFRKGKDHWISYLINKKQKISIIIKNLHKNNNNFNNLTIIMMSKFSMLLKWKRKKSNKIIGILNSNNKITGTITNKIRFIKIETLCKITIILISLKETIILLELNYFYLNKTISSLKWISKAIQWILICDFIDFIQNLKRFIYWNL